MTPFPLAAREGFVVTMRASESLTALVPAGSIYGERVPDDRTFPFIRVSPPENAPFRMSGYNGETTTLNVSAFVKGASVDDAAKVEWAIKRLLENACLDLGDDVKAAVTWMGGRITPDRLEPDCWHSFNTFTVA